MQRDIRDTPLFHEAENLFAQLRQPGTGRITNPAEIESAPDGVSAVFAGTMIDKLEGPPTTRICRIDLASGDVRVLTFGPHTDRLPKHSPDGRHIAFLSDRARAGDFQLYLLDPTGGAVRATATVAGWVEYFHWSPDGTRILLGVAAHGADVAGAQGAVTSAQSAQQAPSWMPSVETGDESHRWRRAWTYELATDALRQVSPTGLNIWETVWCGNHAIAAIASPQPGEGYWYTARLHVMDIATGATREIYTPRDQLGVLTCSPSGAEVAVVEAICSDRWIVAGDLRLIDIESEVVRHIVSGDVDVTHAEWRTDSALLVAGHRGFETVIGMIDGDHAYSDIWASDEVTCGVRYAAVSGIGEAGDCVLVGEGFVRAPEVAVLRAGEYRAIKSFLPGEIAQVKAIATAERVVWSAPDHLELQGWLLRPHTSGPHAVVMTIHGGPVWHWRPAWLGRGGHIPVLLLIARGYAVFLPNPRGSSGRGQSFVRHVLGDMCGVDTNDYLSGLDHLVSKGIADPRRLGVTGGSYGGLMTSWLITQDQRFAAAVPWAPVTNYISAQFISNIPHFIGLFLQDDYKNVGGRYFSRSAVMHAHNVRTPTLNICGALDRCTPPEEAMQFHNALLENGAKSVLVTYPQEGHGVRRLPAAIDFAARVVAWFEEHMPAATAP